MAEVCDKPVASRICILIDRVRTSAFSEGQLIWGWDLQFLKEKLARAGLPPEDIRFHAISKTTAPPSAEDVERCREELKGFTEFHVLVALDEAALRLTTGLKSIHKWHLSPLDASPEFPFRKVIPTFHPDQVKSQWELGLYVEMALVRAREEALSREYTRKPKRFLLNPSLSETFEVLAELAWSDKELALDIETGRGQINTVGFAWSASDAIAINVLPDRCGPAEFRKLWNYIHSICESGRGKITHNGMYELMYLARYGITVRNITHDTQLAQKFLWPELRKALANVGRIHTREPYWKDTGRVETAEDGRKDWGNVRDWPKHYEYNCLDTTGTFEAALSQREDLSERGLLNLYSSYLNRFVIPASEMCLRGLPLAERERAALSGELLSRVAELKSGLTAPDINTNSPKQKLELFRAKGYKIPKVRDPQSGKYRESVNELSLKKMRLVHPEDTDIPKLLEISEHSKALSSYVGVETDRITGNVHFMLDVCGTETGRWSSNKDPWDRGFNAQTIPPYAKKMIRWPDASRLFVEVDLRQAESRFVAYDCCDYDLIRMLEDPAQDIHRYVAAEIFGKLEAAITYLERQLGKKSGHGANYAMKWTTFQESCLKEMDLVLTKAEAERTLEAYHKLFPGIRRWHKTIRDTIYRERRLTTPIGRVRYFYGRMDDNTFREGYAYRPQSTVPDITNHLMLGLLDLRTEGQVDFWFHNQVHDSLIVSCTPPHLDRIAGFMLDFKKWHPEIVLPAGRLLIPTEVKFGPSLGEMQKYGH